ncbi:MCE family protein [Verrucomicrobiaceae bacterium R5-34]|uniref:MCE family protein n=1 Tax=Oceaniferula flava TaxID=2800421 RepID=A0AAE2V8E7_9BACT|nr:MlaD family protein [Oceaniferula flavus]MBK1831278.1 MCE family protein [Verrucomicrobiaceae bacterium R5-34]MBK1855447.1 MCE family protein [Oceaniferula flavus]MBM1136753.1 MCE family protein [Oceaniferula flavus]
MPAREKRRETKAGLFVLIGLVLLGVLVVQFGRFGDRFTGHYPLYIEFPDTAGIIKGSDVRFRGAKIGRVATVPELVLGVGSSTVKMEMSIRDDVQIPIESTFQIGSSGLLGDKFIEISPPEQESGEFFQPGDSIMGAGAGGFDAIKSDAENIAKDASQMIKDAKETFKKIDEALDEITVVGKNLNVTMEKVNSKFLSDDNLDHLSNAMANFDAASKNLSEASKELKPTITDAKKAIASLNQAADSADTLFVDARKEVKNIEPALRELPKAVQSISRAAGKAEETMEALQNENGLVGAMAYDEETGANAKDFVRNLKRYGILRYRDDATKDERDPRNKFRGSRR